MGEKAEKRKQTEGIVQIPQKTQRDENKGYFVNNDTHPC